MGNLVGGKPQSYHPNLTGKVTPEVKLAIDTLFDRMTAGVNSVDQLRKDKPSAAQVVALIGPEAARQLNITGDSPLNVEGLLGGLSQPQKASATPVTSLPGPNDPLSQSGQIVYFNHRLYWFDGSTDPGVWRALGSSIYIDTHANRLANFPAADYQFSLFFESDRTVLYVSDGTNWIYIAGEMYGTFSPLTRPTDLGTSDAKFPFHATDIGETYIWSGTTWNARTEIATALYDTHEYRTFDGTVDVAVGGINVAYVAGPAFSATWIGKKVMVGGAVREVATVPSAIALTLRTAAVAGAGQIFNLYEYASVNFPWATMFFESDRFVYYSVRDVSLLVTIAGGTGVTVTSGRVLDNRWIGATITVTGAVTTTSTILSVTSPTTAVLSAAVPNGAAQIMIVPRGIWQYSAGTYKDTLANIPTGLLTDDYGLRFQATDYFHEWEVNFIGGSFVWRFAAGDCSRYIAIGTASGAPSGGLWGLCDGSSYNTALDDGTIASVATPNMVGDVGILGASAVGAQRAAVKATWDGSAKTEDKTAGFAGGAATEIENTHVHNVNLGVLSDSTLQGAGAPFSFVDPGGLLTGTGSDHQHGLTDANAPQAPHSHDLTNTNAKLNPPSESNGGLGLRVPVPFYMRR